MSDRSDCIHHLCLCPTCDGLRITRMDRLDGVISVSFEAGPFSFSGPAEVYIGPTAETCPAEETP